MKKSILIVLSNFLIFTLLGCATTNPYLGKKLPNNYYSVNCESFPAEGFQKSKDIEIAYQITKMENNKYQITGTANAVFGGDLTIADDQQLVAVFFLLKSNIIVDSVEVPLKGNVQTKMSIKKDFISEKDFDSITIGRLTGRYFYTS